MSDSLKLLALSNIKNVFYLIDFLSSAAYPHKPLMFLVPCRLNTELVSLDVGDVEFAQQPQRLSTQSFWNV